MVFSGIFRRVALVRTNVSEGSSASIIRVTKICKLGTTSAVTTNRHKLRRNATLLVTGNVPSSQILVTLIIVELSSSKTSVHTRATEDGILRSKTPSKYK
jgi:hypothetical protein